MKNFLYTQTIQFLKFSFWSILFFGGMIGGTLFIDDAFPSEDYGSLYAVIFLALAIPVAIYVNYRKSWTKENLHIFVRDAKNTATGLLYLIAYLVLALVGIGLLFLVGGWIASLSATSVIIILLIMILLK